MSTPDPLVQALTCIANLQLRVEELEKQAHSSHNLSQQAIDEIAAQVIARINDTVRQQQTVVDVPVEPQPVGAE